jgi:hypothetical protein
VVCFALADGRREVARPIADNAAIGLDNVKKLREGLNYHPMLDEMLERGVKLDDVTFSTLITCARICSVQNRAVEWFEKMPSFWCVPDDVTYLGFALLLQF